MLRRLWADHRWACLGSLSLLVFGAVVSPWLLLAAVLPIGWVLIKRGGAQKEHPPETTDPFEGIGSIEPLKGATLLAKVKELGDVNKSDLVRSCGYVSKKEEGRK